MIIGMDKLTSSQKALLPSYIEKWDKIQNSTELIDRKRATTAIHAYYQVHGFELPQEIVFVETLKEVHVALLAYLMNDAYPDLKVSECWRVSEDIQYAGMAPEDISNELRTALIDALEKYKESLEAALLYFDECYEYDFLKNISGGWGELTPMIEATLAIAREIGIILMFDKICIASERKIRKELLNK